jgi:hypothetical protein
MENIHRILEKKLPPTTKTCIHQSKIGWSNCLQGFKPTEWTAIQRQHMADDEKHSNNKPEKWAVEFITSIINQLHTLWTECNTATHHRNKNNKSIQTRLRAEQRKKTLYEYANWISDRDKDNILTVSYHDRCEVSTASQLLRWCEISLPSLQK